MKHCLLLLLTVLFYSNVNAQINSKAFTFSCTITDLNGEKIANAVLTQKYLNTAELSQALATNDFTVTIDSNELQSIVISHISYMTYYLTRKEIKNHHRTHPDKKFVIILKPKLNELEQVEITAKKPFYQEQDHELLDYEILSNNNLVLLMQKQVYLVDPRDSILKIIPNPDGISKIVRASSGKIFMANNRYLYPTFIDKYNVLLSKDPVDITECGKQLSEVVAGDSCIRIKEQVSSFNQAIVYKVQSLNDPGHEALLYKAMDAEMLKLVKAEQLEIASDNVGDADHMGEVSGSELKLIRDHEKKVWKFEFFTTKKLYAPIFIKGDSIFIYDYGIRKATVFKYTRSGNSLSFKTILKEPLKQNKKSGWTGEIIQDYYTKEMFAVYRDKSVRLEKLCYFKEAPKTIELPKEHYFADNFKICNNTVYYLWRDTSKPGASKKLYKTYGIQ